MDEPVLFDVGVVALAHAGTPVSEPALEHVRAAIGGDITAIVAGSAVLGAHHVLDRVYHVSRADASRLLSNFMDAQRIVWYDDIGETPVRDALSIAGEHDIEAWDGYYAHVARETGANTVLTIDDDFERVGLSTEVILSSDEFAELSTYIDEIAG